MKNAWALSYPLSAQRRLWSDWADAQADLCLRWAHTHFVGFVISWLKQVLTNFVHLIMKHSRRGVGGGWDQLTDTATFDNMDTSLKESHTKKQNWDIFSKCVNYRLWILCFDPLVSQCCTFVAPVVPNTGLLFVFQTFSLLLAGDERKIIKYQFDKWAATW